MCQDVRKNLFQILPILNASDSFWTAGCFILLRWSAINNKVWSITNRYTASNWRKINLKLILFYRWIHNVACIVQVLHVQVLYAVQHRFYSFDWICQVYELHACFFAGLVSSSFNHPIWKAADLFQSGRMNPMPHGSWPHICCIHISDHCRFRLRLTRFSFLFRYSSRLFFVKKQYLLNKNYVQYIDMFCNMGFKTALKAEKVIILDSSSIAFIFLIKSCWSYYFYNINFFQPF